MKVDCERSGVAAPAVARELEAFPGLKLTFDRPYRELTTLGVGGALPILAEPEDAETLGRLLVFLRKKHKPFFILGNGSNLVGMDKPYDGVGIRLERKAFGDIKIDGDRVVCGARASLPEIAAQAAKAGLHGMGDLSGIPAGIGGAVRMNASCRGTATGELVEEIEANGYARFLGAEG